MSPAQALQILSEISYAAAVPGVVHEQTRAAVQVLAPIVAAHEAKAKADAEHDKP